MMDGSVKPDRDENDPTVEFPESDRQLPRRAGRVRASSLHEQVKRSISEAILTGAWPPGSVVPGEAQIARRFGVAVGTARRALSDLVGEGMITRRPRVGTIVTGRSPHHSLRFFFQYFRLHTRDGMLLHSRTVTTAIERGMADDREAKALGLSPADAVLRVSRVRFVEDRPVMRDRLTFPAERLPGFPHDPAEAPPLLYLHLLERYGIRVAAVREEIHADLATEDDAAELGLERPHPVLVIEEVAYDQAGAPCLLGLHRADTRAHRYVNEVS